MLVLATLWADPLLEKIVEQFIPERSLEGYIRTKSVKRDIAFVSWNFITCRNLISSLKHKDKVDNSAKISPQAKRMEECNSLCSL